MGRVRYLLGSDKPISHDENMPEVVSVEYLNNVDVPGAPPHDLSLKLDLQSSLHETSISTAASLTEKEELYEAFQNVSPTLKFYLTTLPL